MSESTLSITPDTTQMPVRGTVECRAIEEPEVTFMVRVLRAPVFNVLFKAARWEMWKVRAQTEVGALKVAKYHFHRSECIQCLGEA